MWKMSGRIERLEEQATDRRQLIAVRWSEEVRGDGRGRITVNREEVTEEELARLYADPNIDLIVIEVVRDRSLDVTSLS